MKLDVITNHQNSLSYASMLLSGMLMFFVSGLQAQLLPAKEPLVWLKTAPEKCPSDSAARNYIANYPILKLDDQGVEKGLSQVAEERTGTLFLVLRATGIPTDSLLMWLGGAYLYKDTASLHGKKIGLRPIGDSASLVRLTYQGKAGGRHRRADVFIHDEIQLGEVIFFREILEPEQVRIVESYLAMKFSINISRNKEPKFRDYRSLSNRKVWNSKTDFDFDQEILALGRLDRIGFYQSQTYTSDAQNIKLSLSPQTSLGEMPPTLLEDNSLLVVSKKKATPRKGPCGGAPASRLWKFNFVNWETAASHLYISLDTVLDDSQKPFLTDGTNNIPVGIHWKGLRVVLTLPLDSMASADDNLYLLWPGEENDCPPLCRVDVEDCAPGANGKGKLRLKIDQAALPARLSLMDTDGRVSLEQEVEEEDAVVENLGPGQYQMVVHDEKGQMLFDNVFSIEHCRPGPGMSEAGEEGAPETLAFQYEGEDGPPSKSKSALSTGPGAKLPTDARKSVSVFPNPAESYEQAFFKFSNLMGEEVLIEIFDNKASLLARDTFTPTEGKDIYSHVFTVDGTYIIRFSTDSLVEIKQLNTK